MLSKAADFVANQAVAVSVLTKAGIVRPYSPRTLYRMGTCLHDWGMGFAGGFGTLALRAPDQVGLVDELGELTWAEIDARSTRLANALEARGVGEGDSVAVLCRNHRGFVDVSVALSKLGADILYLNTAFAAPQLGEVCERESPQAIVYDEEFTDLVDRAGVEIDRILAWTEGGPSSEVPVLEDLIESGSSQRRTPPEHRTRPVILTSGTTGTPKGAPRGEAGIDAAVALLSRIPMRSGYTVHIAAPLFHTWGWAYLNMSMLLGTTMVLRRKFDPAVTLETVTDHRCDALVVIPVMLQRILRLPDEVKDAHDFETVKIVAASGSALPGDLGTEWMDQFGDNLYNTYGSTEVAWATIADPQDLRTAPGTAGKPPRNTVVRLYDADDRPAAPGEPGRIFVGNSMLFEGYTGDGGNKHSIDGLMSSGDIGRFDDDGYLFVEGRDDEMIVSGGENVFPKEVEDCLARHESVSEAAAVGVEDEEFGKRLRAFVVTDGSVDEDGLKAWVKDNLARYKVPREIVFLDELPRNATGKVLKRELVDYDS